MKMTKHLVGLALTGLVCASPALAQEPTGFVVGAGIGYNFDQPQKTTNSRLNGTVEFGYEGRIYGTDVPFRPMLSMTYIPGKTSTAITTNGLKTSLFNYQVAGDVLFPTPVKGLRSVFGLSLNKWSARNTGTEVPGETAFAIKETKGIKFGARLGLEYTLTSHLTVSGMLQWIELGTSSPELLDTNVDDSNGWPNDIAKGGQNAVLFQVGVKYKF